MMKIVSERVRPQTAKQLTIILRTALFFLKQTERIHSISSMTVTVATGASCHHFLTPAKGNKVKVGWYNVVIRLVAYTYKCPDTFEVVKLR